MAPGDGEQRCEESCAAQGQTAVVNCAIRIPLTSSVVPICKCSNTPNQKGKEGEAKVRSQNDIGDRERYEIDGRRRISDGSNKDAVSEVKNVKNTQSYTQQLRDQVQHAQDTGRSADLYLPESTQVSQPLQNAIDDGLIIRKPIP